MARDIDLFLDGCYRGFFTLDAIEEYFAEYSRNAAEMAENIDWDEVILFAVYYYDDEYLISAELMTLKMNYNTYLELCGKISGCCRVFCIRNRNIADEV